MTEDKSNISELIEPFRHASLEGHTETCRELINAVPEAQRAAFVTAKDNDGDTALHFAAASDDTETCRALIEHDAYTHAQNAKGNKPIDLVPVHSQELYELLQRVMGDTSPIYNDSLDPAP